LPRKLRHRRDGVTGTLSVMRSAARLTPSLLDAVVRIDDGSLPIAEVARRVAAQAENSGQIRPSYERIRQVVHELRPYFLTQRTHSWRLRFAVELGLLRSRASTSRELVR
jgi:hypothetical protein